MPDSGVPLALLVVLNLVAFVAMGLDKVAAGAGRRRIPEARLLGLALVSGGAGSWLAIVLFRHKTRKLGFRVGLGVASVVGACGWIAWFAG